MAACTLLGAASASAQLISRQVAIGGDPFPGRAGEQYDVLGSVFGQSQAIMPDGSVLFSARTRGLLGTSRSDLLRFDWATGQTLPMLQFGAPVPGVADSQLLSAGWPVGGQGGRAASLWSALIGSPGVTSTALVVTDSGGASTTYATTRDPVPGQAVGWTGLGVTARDAQNVTLNQTGIAAFQGSFQGPARLERGVYTAQPGSGITRILDTTQPVPGHAGATWIAPTSSDTPLDESGIGISSSGEVSFRGAYSLGGATQHAIFRGTSSSLIAAADTGRGDQVPGRPAGAAYSRFLNILNNGAGDVAFTAETAGTLERGVYISRGSGPVAKLFDNHDPVPGIPGAEGQSIVQLRGLNSAGDAAVFSNFNLPGGPNGGGGLGLYVLHAGGGSDLAMRYDQLPGLSGVWATSLDTATLNDRGDVLLQAELSGTAGKGLFAYLGDEHQLLPILRVGGSLGGMQIVNFLFPGGSPQGELMGSAGSAQAGSSTLWDDSRRFTVLVTLRAPGSQLLPALYEFQVPAPGACVILMTGLVAAAIRRGRRGVG